MQIAAPHPRRPLRHLRFAALAALSAALPAGVSACGSSSPVVARAPALVAHTIWLRDRPPVSRPGPGRLGAIVAVARATYWGETRGPVLRAQLARIARDPRLLGALARGDYAAAQAAADAQLASPANHTEHVTRIAVARGPGGAGGPSGAGGQLVVNATVNGNGVFVCAPGARVLRVHGRVVGTLLVSIQDVIGYAKLVHNLTHAQVLVRGSSGQVRTSPGASARLPLPSAGRVLVAGRAYAVSTLSLVGWGGEALRVWVLQAL